MKDIFRFVGMASLLAVVLGVGSLAVSAQNPCEDYDGNAALDAKIRENYVKDETLEVAVDASKQYLEKYGACEPFKDFADWVKGQLPGWEKALAEYKERLWLRERLAKFDAGIQGEKYDDVYSAGKEVLAKYPDNLNVMVPLGIIGLYESFDNNMKYADDTISFAKNALGKLKAGAKSTKPNGNYGAFAFERTKEQALSELTYAVAHLTYYAKNDHKGALPYYYEVAQQPGIYQKEPRIYTTLASYYMEQAAPIGTEIAALIKKIEDTKIEGIEDKEEVERLEKEVLRMDAEVKAKVALFNGYVERAIDSYSRAYSVADVSKPSEKTLKDQIYEELKTLWERRGKKDGLDKHIASVPSSPLPNPTSEVQPVADPDAETNAASENTTGSGK